MTTDCRKIKWWKSAKSGDFKMAVIRLGCADSG